MAPWGPDLSCMRKFAGSGKIPCHQPPRALPLPPSGSALAHVPLGSSPAAIGLGLGTLLPADSWLSRDRPPQLLAVLLLRPVGASGGWGPPAAMPGQASWGRGSLAAPLLPHVARASQGWGLLVPLLLQPGRGSLGIEPASPAAALCS